MKSKTMRINKKNNVIYLDFGIYRSYSSLIAVHSTRLGGISEGVFESMNLGFARGDKSESVFENYKLFSNAIGTSYERMVLSDDRDIIGLN